MTRKRTSFLQEIQVQCRSGEERSALSDPGSPDQVVGTREPRQFLVLGLHSLRCLDGKRQRLPLVGM